MNISDDGLKHMLSLGFLKESPQEGIFTLYRWNSVEYFCGSSADKAKFNQNGVYIELSPEQLLSLLQKKQPSSQKKLERPELSKILELYETALYLSFSENDNTFKVTSCDGLLTNLFHSEFKADEPSPFRVVKKTNKPFHGVYSPKGSLSKTLNELNVSTENLWITATPVTNNNKLKGILVGISRDQEYGLDSLKVFGVKNSAA